MKNIEINISNKIATLKEKFVGVCGNSDYVVVFDFDDEWKPHATKTARFKYNGKYTDVVFTGNECPMPVILDASSVEIGVYAGNLHTTTSACVLMKTCILSGSGVPADPTPDVYNQIIDKINDGMLKGEDGVSPSVEVSKSGDTTTIAITDASGVHTAEIKDGSKGDKGDPGADGAPGKDGSDANVTAENIEAALGYVPVTPSDLAAKQDVLTDADKQSITKTGMTTGAAWTAAEQKTARERMGVSGEFELIEEITLSENVMNVAREAFPDGTPYNLRSLIIVVDGTNVENRPDIAGAWVRLNAKLPYDEWTYIAYGDFITTNDSFSCFVYRVLSDGSVDSYFTRSQNATPTSYTTDRVYIPSNVIRFGVHINDFSLYSINNAIPANTKIAIYGVRA